ncbi:MAG: haloacid dehalogenase-like hydrolase, partial [Gemmatimonadaceae bacterium]|nr:haloacid dehalogenase-like hydrolase [Gemmatimonadaceae bacterium]
TTPCDGHEFDGKTDPQIVRELMRLAGHSDERIDAGLSDAITRYVGHLGRELATVEQRGNVYPGIHALLNALAERDDVLLGLLTGNVEAGARAKLAAVGIDGERFRVGAFGSDHEARPELPEIARRRAEALLGVSVLGRDVVVLGDTPADMGCGRGIGARAIGVATGRYSVESLLSCGPAAVFPHLSDTAAVVRAITED